MTSIKVQDTKSAYKNHLHLHTLAIIQSEKAMKKILIVRGSKRIKCLGINLTKKIKDLYGETTKCCWKKLKQHK